MTPTFENKALQFYGEVCVNKGLARRASLGAQSIPMYVSEWIVSRHLVDGQIDGPFPNLSEPACCYGLCFLIE